MFWLREIEITHEMWYDFNMNEKEMTLFANEIDKASTLLEFRVEPEQKPLNKKNLLIFGIMGAAIAIYFALSNNYLAALLLWLASVTIGFTLYTKNKNPKSITCKIKAEGVQVNSNLYPYENLTSFWIFYDPPRHQELSLRSKAPLTGGYIKIPIGEQDPLTIREILLRFIPEKKEEEGIADIVARMIGL